MQIEKVKKVNLFIKKSKIMGTVAVPGSKSHTIRGIVAAMNAENCGETHLEGVLKSADTLSVLHAVEKLGCKVRETKDSFYIQGADKNKNYGKIELDLGNSGTGMRLLTASLSLLEGEFVIDGDSSLRTRLMKPLLDSLSELGVATSCSGDGYAPLSVGGKLRGGKCTTSGVTSQFLSALLFATPLAARDSVIDLEFLNEAPYVGITLGWLEELGLKVKASSDMLHYEVMGNQKIKPFYKVIPADFSTSLFPAVAALMLGDKKNGVAIKNLDFNDLQGDKEVFKILESMGAKIEYGETVKILGGQKLHGGEFDLNKVPDALPILSVLAATLEGETTKFYNVAQARLKETDRIKCMTDELRKMGVEITELADGMIIKGSKLKASLDLESYDDHRIGMALAIAAMTCEQESMVKNIECAAVTYPDFVDDFISLGANFRMEK